MVLLVTTLLEDYGSNFTKVKTIEEAIQNITLYDTVVYNSALDEDSVDVDKMRLLFENAKKIYYIRSEATMNITIRTFVLGFGGEIIPDESALASKASLNALLDGKIISYELALQDNKSVVNAFSRMINDDSVITRAQGQVFVDCANMIMVTGQQAVENEKKTALACVEFLCDTLDKIKVLSENQSDMKQEMQKKIAMVDDLVKEDKKIVDGLYITEPDGVGAPYANINYRKRNVNFILIKDLDRCQYLSTFVAGLQRYFTIMLKLKCRIIVIENTGALPQRKYNSDTVDKSAWVLSNDTSKMNAVMDKDIIFTNKMNKNIYQKLFEDTNYKVTIIVDRTSYTVEHLMQTAYPKSVFYAVQSEASKKLVNADKDQCITSTNDVEAKYHIKKLENWQTFTDNVTKLQNCMYTHKDLYQRLIDSCESLHDFADGR